MSETPETPESPANGANPTPTRANPTPTGPPAAPTDPLIDARVLEDGPTTPETAPVAPESPTPSLPTFNQLDKLADEGKLTEDSLQEKLNAYHAAFEAEFKAANEVEPDKVHETTITYFKNETPSAAAQIVFLAHNADSETVRAGLLKFIVQQGMADAEKEGDPIKELLRSLTTPAKKTIKEAIE